MILSHYYRGRHRYGTRRRAPPTGYPPTRSTDSAESSANDSRVTPAFSTIPAFGSALSIMPDLSRTIRRNIVKPRDRSRTFISSYSPTDWRRGRGGREGGGKRRIHLTRIALISSLLMYVYTRHSQRELPVYRIILSALCDKHANRLKMNVAFFNSIKCDYRGRRAKRRSGMTIRSVSKRS